MCANEKIIDYLFHYCIAVGDDGVVRMYRQQLLNRHHYLPAAPLFINTASEEMSGRYDSSIHSGVSETG